MHLGNQVMALQHAETAVRMDPGNMEYRSFMPDCKMRERRMVSKARSTTDVWASESAMFMPVLVTGCGPCFFFPC